MQFFLTIRVEKLNSVVNPIISFFLSRFGLVLDKVNKISFFNFYQLVVTIIQSQDKVEEIWLAQICRRLFFEMTPMNTNARRKISKKRYIDSIFRSQLCLNLTHRLSGWTGESNIFELASWFFVIILKFIFTSIFAIKIHKKNP